MNALLCVVVAVSLTSRPAAPPAGPIDLFGAIRTALGHNPELAAVQARIAQADANLLDAKSRFYPTLNLEAEYLQADAPSYYLFKRIDQRRFRTGTDFNEPGQMQNSELGVSLTYNLYNGGRDARNVKINELETAVSEDQRRAVENRLIHAVIEAYYDALAAVELIRATQQSVETVEAQLRETKVRFEGGAALRSDVLSLEVRLAQAQEELIRSENARDLSLVLLANLMGLEDWSGLEISGEDWRPREIPEDSERALPEAFEDRPEASLSRTIVERSLLDTRQAKSEYLPTVDAFARLYFDDNTFGYRADDANWAVGVGLGWEIFSGPRRKAHRRLAEARVDEMSAMERLTRDGIRLDVNRAYLSLRAARTRHDVAVVSVKNAEESLRLVRRQYEGGAATVTRYLNAEQDLTASRVREITARYDVKKANADVGRALGWCSQCAREALGEEAGAAVEPSRP